MKKYLCSILACLLTFVLIGCSNNTDVNQVTSPYENITKAELTNPGEYLSELCTNVKIDDTQFSLPCTFEDLNENFIINEIEAFDTVSLDDYDVKTFNLFTRDNKYFGTISFAYYPDGSNRVWMIDKNYLNDSWYTPLEKGDEHRNDITYMEFNGLTTDISTLNDVTKALGKGNSAYEENYDFFLVTYTFEDGAILVWLSSQNKVAVNFALIFIR